MFFNDKIYQTYLEEMEALEAFRTSHLKLHRDTPLDLLEDPDTLRLVESLAFFAARSRLQGLHQISQIHQVLFRQYFSFLVNPIPSMGLLRFEPSLQVPDAVTLPEGSEVLCKTYDKRKASFQTLCPTTIFPLFFDKFDFFRKAQGQWQLEMAYTSSHTRSDSLGTMTFHINYLNSFIGSLRTYFALSRSIEAVQVFYNEKDTKGKAGTPCEFEFGIPGEAKVLNHPLEKLRSRLHFPEQEMFITVKLPPATEKWFSITFTFHLNEKWPENIILTKSSLTPFVVPIVNLKNAKGDPIECDGTRDTYPILYPNPKDAYTLHSILGVFEILPEGMRPILPGILDKRRRAYEMDYFDQKIHIDLPGAFVNPRQVMIDALWSQLWFTDYIDQEFKLQVDDQQVSELSPKLLRQMKGHEISTVVNDPKFLLQILSLKNQNRLNLNEILFLIGGFKRIDLSEFKMVPSLIKNLNVVQQLEKSSVGPTIRYEFYLKEWDGRHWETAILFFRNVNDFLSSWLANFHVETAIFFPHIKTPLIFKGGRSNELSILARDFYLS